MISITKLPYQGNYCKEFARVLQRLNMPAKAVVFHLNRFIAGKYKEVKLRQYYKWRAGENPFPPDLISYLFKITKDPHIYDFLTRGTGLIAVPHIRGSYKMDTKVFISSATYHLGQMIHRYETGKKLRSILNEGVEAIRHIRGFMERARWRALK